METLALFETDGRPVMERSAEISDCGLFRWWLRRAWPSRSNTAERVVCFVMLNPSTADGLVDDPTIRRCINFARDWGFDALEVRNLFAFRATDPRDLLHAADPVGGERANAEIVAATTADLVVCAWGANVPFGRDREVVQLLRDTNLHCLGLTKAGYPRHPLYMPAAAQPIPFAGRVDEVPS